MEIVIGLIIAIYWILKDERHSHYEKDDWSKISKDIINRLK